MTVPMAFRENRGTHKKLDLAKEKVGPPCETTAHRVKKREMREEGVKAGERKGQNSETKMVNPESVTPSERSQM